MVGGLDGERGGGWAEDGERDCTWAEDGERWDG